jgi:hypothetical protein
MGKFVFTTLDGTPDPLELQFADVKCLVPAHILKAFDRTELEEMAEDFKEFEYAAWLAVMESEIKKAALTNLAGRRAMLQINIKKAKGGRP